MEKIFHCEGHPERFTELHEEEEKKEGDRDGLEDKKGDSRGERQIYAVVCSQSVLHSPDTHRDSQNWTGKRRGREEIEVIWGRKRRVKKRERVIKSVIALLSKNRY